MLRAIYPGSFDPITNGHLDVLYRASRLFDEVIFAVANNQSKQALFSVPERVELMSLSCQHIPNVRVASFDGLLVDFARKSEAKAVVRGLRAVSDFEFEFQMALMNRSLEPSLEAIFLMPSEEYSYISSRMVKEVARLGGEVGRFVPKCVEAALKTRFDAEKKGSEAANSLRL
ncbi:MAG: pantetheine-phosphate adenylyltransferase [Verrucomicrobia bacterium]|nr:pantetheine-phosphate adenylyltransferase [Verrucomicrobiota bacterium]